MEEQENIVKATHGSPDHPLKIGDVEIPCYVLEDGRRVLHQKGMITSLGMSQGTGQKSLKGDRLAKFVSGKSLEPYISGDLSNVIINPIRFKTTRGAIAYGYEATVLADICEAVLKARSANALNYQQTHIAEKCEVLVRGFARVGIIALVDEATGYQAKRDRDELHKILEAYIAKELLPWTKRFPDEFYKELFRLRGWQYNPLSIARPGYVGTLTNELVYEKLPPGVLEELKAKNPKTSGGNRRHRYHQFLTEDTGNLHLEKHLSAVITLMRISSSWAEFERLFERAFPGSAIQSELEFEEAE